MRVGGQLHAPAALPPGKRPGTHCIGGWVGPRAGLDGCEKSRPHRDFFLRRPKMACVYVLQDGPQWPAFTYYKTAHNGLRLRITRRPPLVCFTYDKTAQTGLLLRVTRRLRGFDPRTVQPVASRYTDYAMPALFVAGYVTKYKLHIHRFVEIYRWPSEITFDMDKLLITLM
jgi:hypothetical protein